jgi:hypothetical protein
MNYFKYQYYLFCIEELPRGVSIKLESEKIPVEPRTDNAV